MDEMKKLLNDTAERLAAIKEKVQQRSQTLGDKAEDLRESLAVGLARMENRLKEGAQHLKQDTDEARLQAHLAAMEVGQWWEETGKALDKLSGEVRADLDTAALKAHLAKLEAQEFMENDGKAYLQRFNKARKEAEAEARSVIKTLREHAEKVAQNFRREGP